MFLVNGLEFCRGKHIHPESSYVIEAVPQTDIYIGTVMYMYRVDTVYLIMRFYIIYVKMNVCFSRIHFIIIHPNAIKLSSVLVLMPASF